MNPTITRPAAIALAVAVLSITACRGGADQTAGPAAATEPPVPAGTTASSPAAPSTAIPGAPGAGVAPTADPTLQALYSSFAPPKLGADDASVILYEFSDYL